MEMIEMTERKSGYAKNGFSHQTVFDVLVIGGGITGATMAAYLGNAGKKVAVIEKDFSEQDRIVGELLQPGGVKKLHELGLADCLEGIDSAPVSGYAIFKEGKQIHVPYPESGFLGRGFHNGRFVQQLRAKITNHPNITLFEGTAVNLLRNTEGKINGAHFSERFSDEELEIKAHLTLVSDGFFSIFRKELSDNKPKLSGFFLGLVLKNTALPYPNHGHVFITDTSPFLAYPISRNEIRMLIDFPGTMPPKKSEALKKELRVRILPFLHESLHEAFLCAVEEGDFKVMPNHYMPGKPKIEEGAALLGDALNMRHPLTGGGMTACFTDILALGQLLATCEDFSNRRAVKQLLHQFYTEKRRENSTINILADALYRVFIHKPLADACFEYLARGGKFAEEPVSILSGISRNRKLLISHFFAVAGFGAKNLLRKGKGMGSAYRMVNNAFQIVYPLIMNEKPGLAEKIILKSGKLVFPATQQQ